MINRSDNCTEQKEKVLVTGAGGFIGSHLVESLLEKGYKVVCLLKPGEDIRWIKDLDVEFVYGDLTDKKSLYEPVRGISYVYHLAARMGGGDDASYVYAVNYDGSKNLIEACMKSGESGVKLKRFLFVSSFAAVGPTGDSEVFDENTPPNPKTHYGKSKLMVEQYLEELGDKFPYSIVRLPLVYGPRSMRGLFVIFKMVKLGIQLLVGKSHTNVGFVKDIAEGMIAVAQGPAALGQVDFLGENQIYSSREIFGHIAGVLGKKTLKVRLPYFLIYGIAYCVEKLSDLTGKNPPIRSDSLSSYLNTNWRFSMSKVSDDLNFKTRYPFPRGLEVTADWYKENGFL
jgi:nucleoside-diphosphate-sugar epimerase